MHLGHFHKLKKNHLIGHWAAILRTTRSDYFSNNIIVFKMILKKTIVPLPPS